MTVKIERKHQNGFHIDDLSYWVVTTMETVEKISGLSGQEKKDMVIKKVLDIVDDDGDNVIVQMLLPQLIDTLVEVDGKGLRLNQDVYHDAKVMFRGFIGLCKDVFRSCGCIKN